MSFYSPILADSDGFSASKLLGSLSLTDESLNQMILTGACVLVTVGLFIWAAFFRKARRKKRRRAHHSPRWEQSPDEDRTARRRRRRQHVAPDLPRNPTRAETGGLPPIRRQSGNPGDESAV